MKKILLACKPFLLEILHDAMLAACLVVPIFMALIFHFGVPALETVFCAELGAKTFLAPYYLLFDLLVLVMVPVMFAFAGVMTVLGELDTGTARYLTVTPIGRDGYLWSRIGLPSAVAAVYAFFLLWALSLTPFSLPVLAALCVGSALYGALTSLLVVVLAKNKVEGMAVVKLSSVLMLGIPAVFFLPMPTQYLAAWVPTYWLARFALAPGGGFLTITVLLSLIWIAVLNHLFAKRLL